METGFDKEKLEALKAWCLKQTESPGRLRLIVASLILLAGLFLYCKPQAQRLEKARAHLKASEHLAGTAKELRHFVKQVATYSERLTKQADIGEWQNYLMTKLPPTGAELQSLEPQKVISRGSFRVVLIKLNAGGTYEELIDLIDRLERGERIVRLDRLSLTKGKTSLALSCHIKGLVKIGAVKSPPGEK